MIQLLKQLFGFLGAVGRFLADRQLLEAGKMMQREANLKELMDHEDKAKSAVATPDPERDKRLRNRFDRSRRK